MTNPSETRDSELVARARELAGAIEFSPIGARKMLRRLADTIDRLTSTGEAVWYQQRQKREGEAEWSNWYDSSKDAFEEWQRGNIGGKYFFGPAIYEVRALYASPREGHVEVPVEGLDRDELLGITEYLMMQADIDTPDDTEPDCDDLCGNRVCAAVGCVVRKFRRVRAALPHNQGETIP